MKRCRLKRYNFQIKNKMNKENKTLDKQQNGNDFIADVSKSLAPHRCPVCNGNGLVPNGFYMQTSGHLSTSSITPETCRSCGGTGIVWG